MDSGARGMNPVAITIINPRQEYWPTQGSNQRPPVLKSAMLLTELWDLGMKTCENLVNSYKALPCNSKLLTLTEMALEKSVFQPYLILHLLSIWTSVNLSHFVKVKTMLEEGRLHALSSISNRSRNVTSLLEQPIR